MQCKRKQGHGSPLTQNRKKIMRKIHEILLRILLEADMYKVGESDTFELNGWTYTLERTEKGWKLVEGTTNKFTYEDTELSRLLRSMLGMRCVSY